ncbi:MAG: NAD-glutamate dehydrogenase [Acidimicrobiia bacterium]|nr:NAD-glutamate dehydrogenase [Acidimicrobiia bacterium]
MDTLSAVLERIATAVPGSRGEAIAQLAKAYLRHSEDDTLSVDETYARVIELFGFIEDRSEKAKIRAFNSTMAEHGYTSTGTVLELSVDDGPFLFDTVAAELHRHDLKVLRAEHPVIGTVREDNVLTSIVPGRQSGHRESVQHFELNKRLDAAEISELETAVRRVISDAQQVAVDHQNMLNRVDRMISLAHQADGCYPEDTISEISAFLDWLRKGNFIFLGYREYAITTTSEGKAVNAVPDSGFGLLRDMANSKVGEPVLLSSLRPELAARYLDGPLLTITKTNRRSSVQRDTKMDYIGLRLVNEKGETTGEARLIGLFTTKSASESALETPILRRKLQAIIESEDLIEGSRDHKAAIQMFDGFSKHDLFASPTADLKREVVGLLQMAKSGAVHLYVRRDQLERSVFVLLSLPHESFNARLRRQLQSYFLEKFRGTSVDYHLNLAEATAAQIHFTIWVDEDGIPEVPFSELEADVRRMARSWRDQVYDALVERGADAERLCALWCDQLPEYYRSSTPLAIAAMDLENLDALATSGSKFRVGVHNEPGHTFGERLTRITLYREGEKQTLTELVPALENLGLQVVEEVPTRVRTGQYLHDFGVLGQDGEPLDADEVGGRIAAALEAVWSGASDSDTLSGLIVSAGLDHHQVEILRAYRTYWRRIRPVFTEGYINEALLRYGGIAGDVVRLFEDKFDPGREPNDLDAAAEAVLTKLDAVPTADDDRILRALVTLVQATMRTNYYQPDRRVLSLKMRSALVPDIPAPRPLFEIFVLGPHVEGIHLRGGMVARGGLRASDRREDYRTEVLGLMKAQMTKNAVIVPDGAKGGFVLRNPPTDRDEHRVAVQTQYEEFVAGLLDVTDNLIDGKVVHPPAVRYYDGDDTYLVVAADKGTATFSDLANSIAARYNFWLGDAFASGGSAGYDHKALAITAKGAWESLKRHFGELGLDPAEDEFRVVGIGDMSGDVFGNGMLLSDKIKLVAAFDHRHIMIDPDPDPTRSFAERQRLFNVPRSSWDDYNRDLISAGGAIWPRSAKTITLSEAAREAIGTDVESFTPTELISAILKAPVDVLWNGGIGTYVKASSESHEEVGDRSNDGLRVNGADLRTRVVTEGGNLGLTQQARIEFAHTGGNINTDFIDNSGGVDCSDREVNLKILLRTAMDAGRLTLEERDELIAAVAPDVVKGVLYDNYLQAQILSQEVRSSAPRLDAHEDLMAELEAEGILDRAIEGLPTTEQMTEKRAAGEGLTRPELAVLLAYSKRSLREAIESSVLLDDPYFDGDLREYFPPAVTERFGDLIAHHPLRKRLIATILSNEVINSEGPTFVSRLCQRVGAEKAEVIKAYRIAREASGVTKRWDAIEELFDVLETGIWHKLMSGADALVAALTRRYLAEVKETTPIGEVISTSVDGYVAIEAIMDVGGSDRWRTIRASTIDHLVISNVPVDVAKWYAYGPIFVHAPGAIRLAQRYDRDPLECLQIMLAVGEAVRLDRLDEVQQNFTPRVPWERWAIQSIMDDLIGLRRRLGAAVLRKAEGLTGEEAVAAYVKRHAQQIARIDRVMASFETASHDDLTPMIVAIRQVRTLLA